MLIKKSVKYRSNETHTILINGLKTLINNLFKPLDQDFPK